MKKNIGLITWYGSKNYGTNVQVYALYKKIKELGYPCDLIAAFNSNNFSWKAHLRYVLSFFNSEETIKSVKAINDLKQKKNSQIHSGRYINKTCIYPETI